MFTQEGGISLHFMASCFTWETCARCECPPGESAEGDCPGGRECVCVLAQVPRGPITDPHLPRPRTPSSLNSEKSQNLKVLNCGARKPTFLEHSPAFGSLFSSASL